MNLGDVGLMIRAYDINGDEVRGDHHKSVVCYRLCMVANGEVLQEWLTSKHPDVIAYKATHKEV